MLDHNIFAVINTEIRRSSCNYNHNKNLENTLILYTQF